MKITFLSGPYAGKKYEFDSPCVTVGRDESNQLVLDTDGVSRFHAELRQQPDGSWLIYDLNSTNGVKIDGNRIESAVSVNGNMAVTIGENVLKVEAEAIEQPRVIFNPVITAAPAANSAPVINSGSPVFKDPAPKAAGAAPQTPPVASVKAEPLPKAPQESEKPSGNGENAAAALALDIKKFSGSLFGQKEKNKKSSPAPENGGDGKKRRSNIIFYTIVVCVVIMILSAAFSILNPKGKNDSPGRKVQPLTVRYEKEVISKGNVFRFDFLLESGLAKKEKTGKDGKKRFVYEREYSVKFTIDDIASQRHFTRTVPISDETVDELRSVIRSSGIFANARDEKGGSDAMNRRLTIVDGNRLLDCSVPGEFASTEFNAVEDAVVNVAKTFGLETISMTPEQLTSQAKKNFLNAEDLFDNRRAGGRNLRDAIKYYRAVTDALEQFSPRPPMWDQARIKLAAAEKEEGNRKLFFEKKADAKIFDLLLLCVGSGDDLHNVRAPFLLGKGDFQHLFGGNEFQHVAGHQHLRPFGVEVGDEFFLLCHRFGIVGEFSGGGLEIVVHHVEN